MAGYHNPMPTAFTCAVRHMIRVASQFIGWIFPNINTFPHACPKSAQCFQLGIPRCTKVSSCTQ